MGAIPSYRSTARAPPAKDSVERTVGGFGHSTVTGPTQIRSNSVAGGISAGFLFCPKLLAADASAVIAREQGQLDQSPRSSTTLPHRRNGAPRDGVLDTTAR